MSIGKLRMNTSDLASLMTLDITLYFLPIPDGYLYLAYTHTLTHTHIYKSKSKDNSCESWMEDQWSKPLD